MACVMPEPNKFPSLDSCKKVQTCKRLKERFLIGSNRTKRANFRGSPLFQATYNIKTEKQTTDTTYLVSVGCGRLAEGKEHETEKRFLWTHKEVDLAPHPVVGLVLQVGDTEKFPHALGFESVDPFFFFFF